MEKIEISSKFLYEIETGKKGFLADILCRISQALSVSCDYIMFGKEVSCRGSEKLVCVLEMIKQLGTVGCKIYYRYYATL